MARLRAGAGGRTRGHQRLSGPRGGTRAALLVAGPPAAGPAAPGTSGLYRQFREQLGTGPVSWLTRSRAEAAAALLVQTDLPVAAVGRRVGWPDPSYASRRFASVYALSPTAYRTAHRDRPTATALD